MKVWQFYDDGTSKVLLKTFEMPGRQQSQNAARLPRANLFGR